MRPLVARWRSRGLAHQLAWTAIAVSGLSLVAKLAAAAKDVVLARKFGTSAQVDAYYIAFALPSLILNIMSATIQASFVPAFVQLKERDGKEAAQRLLSSWLVVLMCTVLASAVLLAATAPLVLPLLGTGFGTDKLALTRSLFYVLMPTLVVNGLGAGILGGLNANESFTVGALIAVVNPAAAAACIFGLSSTIGIYAVAVGTLAGFGLETILLAVALVRRGWSPVPRWHGIDPWIRRLARQSLPMLAASAMATGNGTVDQAMAASLGTGSVAAMTYGLKITTAFQLVAVTAVGTVVLPQYARLAGETTGTSALRGVLHRQGAMLLAVAVPLTLVLTLASGEIVHVLFQGGSFSAHDAHVVSRVQSAYALQVPFYALGILGVRALSALEANASVMWISLVNLIANVLADLLGKWLFGVVGIALATSFVYVGSLVMIALTLRRKLLERDRALKEFSGDA